MRTAHRVIGVDLGGTKILVGVVDPDGRVESHREYPTPVDSTDALLAGLEAAIAESVEGADAIGIGVPGTIDRRAGAVVYAPNVPLAGVELRERLRDRFGIPVALDNDANVAAIGEWRAGAGRGHSDFVVLTLGTGVGGGIVSGGRPFRGSTGAGAELGHMVVDYDGRECACGGRGHLEAYASGTAADERAREVFGPAADAHRLVRLANEGDERARAVLAEIGTVLGAAVASLVNTFEPQLVAIGGGFAAAGDWLLEPARARVAIDALPPGRDTVRIVRAELGTSAGLVGAGFVGYEALEDA